MSPSYPSPAAFADATFRRLFGGWGKGGMGTGSTNIGDEGGLNTGKAGFSAALAKAAFAEAGLRVIPCGYPHLSQRRDFPRLFGGFGAGGMGIGRGMLNIDKGDDTGKGGLNAGGAGQGRGTKRRANTVVVKPWGLRPIGWYIEEFLHESLTQQPKEEMTIFDHMLRADFDMESLRPQADESLTQQLEDETTIFDHMLREDFDMESLGTPMSAGSAISCGDSCR